MESDSLSLLKKRLENGKVQTNKYDEIDLPVIHMEREMQNETIQQAYNKCDGYTDKLKFIYNLLSITQESYLKYTNNEFLSESYLNSLIHELEDKENIDESYFFQFVNEKIVKQINSGHVKLNPIEIEDTTIEDTIKDEKRELELGPNTNSKGEIDRRNIIVQEIKDGLYIKIKSFSSKHLAQDQEIFEKVEEYLSENKIENIIFDIRGNTGGTDEYFKNLSVFTNKDIVFLERFRNLLTNENQEITYTVIPANFSAQEYNNFLLVDGTVFSTAETLAMICKSTGFAKVVGESTGGEGFGFTPFSLNIVDTNTKYIRKENNKEYTLSGVKMSFPIEAPINENGDIDYEDYYKTMPDIVCDIEKGENPLDKTLEEIQKKEKEELKEEQKEVKEIKVEDEGFER